MRALECQMSDGMYILAPLMVRLFISVFCSLAIPTLLVWAYSLWNKSNRRELPHWRNGMGLASITIIFASWSIQLLGLALFLSHVNMQSSQNFEWFLTGVRDLPFTARTFARAWV